MTDLSKVSDARISELYHTTVRDGVWTKFDRAVRGEYWWRHYIDEEYMQDLLDEGWTWAEARAKATRRVQTDTD